MVGSRRPIEYGFISRHVQFQAKPDCRATGNAPQVLVEIKKRRFKQSRREYPPYNDYWILRIHRSKIRPYFSDPEPLLLKLHHL